MIGYCGSPTPCSPDTDIYDCPWANYSEEVLQRNFLIKEWKTETTLPYEGCKICHNFVSLNEINEVREMLGLELIIN